MKRTLCFLLGVSIALTGCRGDTESELPDRGLTPQEEVTEPRDLSEAREAFGLPLPPEVISVRRTDQRVRATTNLSMQELREFFEARLIDYEILHVGARLEILPLRPHSSKATAYYFLGNRSHIVVEYFPPPDLAEQERVAEFSKMVVARMEEQAAENPQFRRDKPRRERVQTHHDQPLWVESLYGEPVELRTPDGELLAPGARWGQPYTPPEGSPLHSSRNRHNFGRPFGDWKSH